MATEKKAAAKKVAPKAAEREQTFDMPVEVKEWIERAQSIMSHRQGEIDRLKKELADLKAYKKFAETRLLRSDHE